ncbi:MAG: hypothetical protein U1E20_04365 [Methylocystis sp.]|uniref:hypothetical protein n=1 Tax=Methylocystis sp. TaxID=1911079 RepID=UPI003963F4EC
MAIVAPRPDFERPQAAATKAANLAGGCSRLRRFFSSVDDGAALSLTCAFRTAQAIDGESSDNRNESRHWAYCAEWRA